MLNIHLHVPFTMHKYVRRFIKTFSYQFSFCVCVFLNIYFVNTCVQMKTKSKILKYCACSLSASGFLSSCIRGVLKWLFRIFRMLPECFKRNNIEMWCPFRWIQFKICTNSWDLMHFWTLNFYSFSTRKHFDKSITWKQTQNKMWTVHKSYQIS